MSDHHKKLLFLSAFVDLRSARVVQMTTSGQHLHDGSKKNLQPAQVSWAGLSQSLGESTVPVSSRTGAPGMFPVTREFRSSIRRPTSTVPQCLSALRLSESLRHARARAHTRACEYASGMCLCSSRARARSPGEGCLVQVARQHLLLLPRSLQHHFMLRGLHMPSGTHIVQLF